MLSGKRLAAVTNKGKIHTWDLVANTETVVSSSGSSSSLCHSVGIAKQVVPAHKRYALRCKFSPDSSMLATTSADQTARLWRTSDYELINVS